MYRDRKGNYHKKPSNIKSKKRESAYGVFIENNKILLVKLAWANLWELPGGGKEQNEDLISTLKREFAEETGFEILEFNKKPFQIINTKFYADDLDEFFESKMYFYKIKKLGTQNKSLINKDEIMRLDFIQISKLNKKNMNELHLEIISKLEIPLSPCKI